MKKKIELSWIRTQRIHAILFYVVFEKHKWLTEYNANVYFFNLEQIFKYYL